MKYLGYKIIFIFLQALMLIKRGVLWLGRKMHPSFEKTIKGYQNTLGFSLYKVYFFAKRRVQKWLAPWKSGFIFVLGKRSSLQIILFLVGIFIMIPHTKLYSQKTNSLPGRKTLLYTLVGPGDQDYQLEEISFNATAPKALQPSWAEGAILQQQPGTGQQIAYEPKELSSIGAGGQALIKPTIFGTGSNTVTSASEGSRSEIIIHDVQQGEVIGQIASRYGIKIETILWANNLTVRSYIRPGDKLKILPTDGVTHKVVKGDTIAKIARKYDSKEADIISTNRLKENGSDIVIGEELIIPGGKRVVTAPSVASKIISPIKNIVAPSPSIDAPAGSGYLWPAGVRRITQYFGWRHTGLDIAGPVGTPLYATRGGRVIRSQCGWNGGYGCYVILDHGGGVTSLYGHASKLLAELGEQVSQGQVIALMGSTGRSTGPHIHFEIRINGGKDNPLKYIR